MSKNYTDVQLTFVAHCIAAGDVDEKSMCRSADLTMPRLKKILAGDIPSHQLAVYESHLERARSRHALARVKHVAELSTMTDDAYTAIRHAVQDFESNAELAFRAAKEILQMGDAPVEAPGTAPANQVNTQINLGMDQKGQTAMDVFIESVKQTTSQMGSRLPPIGTPSPHLSISEAEAVGDTPMEREKLENTEGEAE